MQLAMNDEVIPRLKAASSFKVSLTERDYNIIEFVSNMKFVSVEDAFVKFFRITQKNTVASSMLWAEDRLQQLEKAGFLKSVRSFSEKCRFYVATPKSYFALANRYPERAVVKPLSTIDIRTFYHDRLVTKARIDLEQSEKVSSWISDRQLRSFKELAGGLSRNQVPDGIYTLPDSKRIAFEAEIAVKAKGRYKEKIQKYVQIMRSKDARKIFDKVHYICARPIVEEHLERETKIYGDLFVIESVSGFLERKKEASI